MEEDEVLPETILYELVCSGEWKEEREEQVSQILPRSHEGGWTSYLNPRRLIGKRTLSVAESVRWMRGLGPQWQIALSPDGKVVAVLQSSVLETRSLKDNFSSTMGRMNVLKDPHCTFRLMAWSLDSLMLAISFSNGQIVFYDTMAVRRFAVHRFSLPSQEEQLGSVFSTDNNLAGLFFASERVKKCSYRNEIVSVDVKGIVRCYRQTNTDQMSFHHEASLRKHYPKGVYAATFIPSSEVMLVSGPLEVDADKYLESSQKYGITAWRLMNDAPYYTVLFNLTSDGRQIDPTLKWRFSVASLFTDSSAIRDGIFKLSLSPNQKFVAALHTSGTITVWHLPSLSLYRKWPIKDQFHHWAENSRFNNRWRIIFNRWNEEPIDGWRHIPLDLNWWNDEIVVISRVNGCVSLCYVDEEFPTKNLLGDFPETFESPAYVTPRNGKGFLSIECELKLKIEERRDSNGEVVHIPNSSKTIELPPPPESQLFPKTICQEVIFWMTDMESFRPPRKRKRKPPIWIETYRLFLLRSITPQELFHQKIEAEEYGEALDLAKAYKLDSDIVYQRQWSKSTVSVVTIRDYLGKIKKRNWVLQECLERVPPDVDAASELLTFGLNGTDLEAAVMMSQGKDKGLFHLLTPDDLEISNQEYLMLVDQDNLEVKRLLCYRKQFLNYLDMLTTYELMIGGPRMVEENFDGSAYVNLRSRNPIDSCIDMARNSDVAALSIMLRRHWSDIASQYLNILSSFPETTCPHDYSDFLPVVTNKQVTLWDDIALKDRDWCERFLESDHSLQQPIKDFKVTVDEITKWYEDRVHQIEDLSGITSYALDLARLGVQRNVPGLGMLVTDLEVVSIMVYDANVDVTLEKLEELCPIDRLQTLMSNTTEKTFVHNLRDYVMPFLEKCEAQEKGSRFHILDQYLTSVSTHDLSKAALVFENSRPGISSAIISDVTQLVQLAYNCIYACKSPKQEEVASILTCLPERHMNSFDDELLNTQLEDLDLEYQGLKILNKYNIFMSFMELKMLSSEEEGQMEAIFKKICDTPRTAKPPMKTTEWKMMLHDILDLQKKVLRDFPMELCFELYVESLLGSGLPDIINLSRDFIGEPEGSIISGKGPSQNIRRGSSAYSNEFGIYLYLIPYAKSLEMVIRAAQHYFDSAIHYSDPDIELCKVCLKLMQTFKESEVCQMFDMIDAIKIINKEFQLSVLPQNVRLSTDKLGLVRQSMENIADGYKKVQLLLKLTLLLVGGDGNNLAKSESWVYDLCGNAALAAQDMKFCVQICERIVAKGYETGWRLFIETANYEGEPPILDAEMKRTFMNYSLHTCPDDQIVTVVQSKSFLEATRHKSLHMSKEDQELDKLYDSFHFVVLD